MAAPGKFSVSILRNIIREVRKILPTERRVSESLAVRHVMSQYRLHQMTPRRVCKGQLEVQTLAEHYHVYLRSSRQYRELCEKYQSRGERSLEESANLVGLKMPKSYNPAAATPDSPS